MSTQKTNFFFKEIVIATTILVATFSCGKKDEGNSKPALNPNRLITAKVNGVLVNFTSTSLADVPFTGLNLYRGNVGNQDISISAIKSTVGTFSLDTSNYNSYHLGYSLNVGIGSQVDYGVVRGSLVITAHSPGEFIGTFSGTCVNYSNPKDSVVITEGVFTYK